MKPNPDLSLKQERVTASLELVFAGALWGFGFIAAIWALRGMGPYSATGWRMALASLTGFAVMLAIPRLRSGFSLATLRLSAIPGLMIALTLLLQTWGLQTTSAGKSGFLTTLYVVIVPIIERLWLRKRLERGHGWIVAVAMVGSALIGDFTAGIDAWNTGDLLTIGCAFAAAMHIVWLGHIQAKIGAAFAFNVYQSFWAMIPTLILSLIYEPLPRPSLSDLSLVGLCSLAFGSTLIAFAFQVKAQKILSPSLVSLLFLLEAPFAVMFGILILDESFKPEQWVGAGLILCTAALVSFRAARGEPGTEA